MAADFLAGEVCCAATGADCFFDPLDLSAGSAFFLLVTDFEILFASCFLFATDDFRAGFFFFEVVGDGVRTVAGAFLVGALVDATAFCLAGAFFVDDACTLAWLSAGAMETDLGEMDAR